MAKQSGKQFVDDLNGSIVTQQYAESFGQLWRKNIVACFARETTSKQGLVKYVTKLGADKPHSFVGNALNFFAWPYFVVRTLRTSFNYLVDKTDSSGSMNFISNKMIMGSRPLVSSVAARRVKRVFNYLLLPLEAACYGVAKFGDLITGGVKLGRSGIADVELKTVGKKPLIKTITKPALVRVPSVPIARPVTHPALRQSANTDSKSEGLGIASQVTDKTKLAAVPSKNSDGFMPASSAPKNKSNVVAFAPPQKAKSALPNVPLEKKVPSAGIAPKENEDTAQIFKDLHEHTTHAHPVGKKSAEVREHFSAVTPKDQADIPAMYKDPDFDASRKGKKKSYYDISDASRSSEPKSGFVEKYGKKSFLSRMLPKKKDAQDDTDAEGEGNPFEPPVNKKR